MHLNDKLSLEIITWKRAQCGVLFCFFSPWADESAFHFTYNKENAQVGCSTILNLIWSSA